MLKKAVMVLGFITILGTGCAGRTPHPISVAQIGDPQMSCQALRKEISHINTQVQKLIPKSDKSTRNFALGAAGLVIWPAWLFMDLSQADKKELKAYQARHQHLVKLYNAKQCSKTK